MPQGATCLGAPLWRDKHMITRAHHDFLPDHLRSLRCDHFWLVHETNHAHTVSRSRHRSQSHPPTQPTKFIRPKVGDAPRSWTDDAVYICKKSAQRPPIDGNGSGGDAEQHTYVRSIQNPMKTVGHRLSVFHPCGRASQCHVAASQPRNKHPRSAGRGNCRVGEARGSDVKCRSTCMIGAWHREFNPLIISSC